MKTCPNCGGVIIGDGYTIVLHCENADYPNDVEPDAPIIYCEPETTEELEKGGQE